MQEHTFSWHERVLALLFSFVPWNCRLVRVHSYDTCTRTLGIWASERSAEYSAHENAWHRSCSPRGHSFVNGAFVHSALTTASARQRRCTTPCLHKATLIRGVLRQASCDRTPRIWPNSTYQGIGVYSQLPARPGNAANHAQMRQHMHTVRHDVRSRTRMAPLGVVEKHTGAMDSHRHPLAPIEYVYLEISAPALRCPAKSAVDSPCRCTGARISTRALRTRSAALRLALAHST